MFKGFQLFVFVCSCVVCLLLGGGVVHSCESGKVARTDSTVTVTSKPLPAVHDTIYRDSIRVKRIAVTRPPTYVHDTVTGRTTIVQRVDTATCYSVAKDTMGAHIEAQICSDSLPRKKPLDLMATIYYQAPPVTEKTIHLTTTVIKPGPLFSDWKFWTGCVVFLIAGGYAGHTLK